MPRHDQRFEDFGTFPAPAPARRLFHSPATLGFHPTQVKLPTRNMVVVGEHGAGKTNLLQSVISAAVSSPDAAVTVVDMEAGALAFPWLAGSPDHLVLDRVAANGPAALSVFNHHIAVAQSRQARLRRAMILHNLDRVPTGNGRDLCGTCGEVHPPHLVLAVSDFAGLPDDAREALGMIVRMSRGFGISVAFGSLRCAPDFLPSWALRATSVQIGLKMSQPRDESRYLFNGDYVPVEMPGQGLIRVDGGPVMPFYPFLNESSNIKETAQFAAMFRPEMGDEEADLGGEDYARRWDTPDVQQMVKAARGS
jgi:hypothetical protein